ncbi:HU-CCDC81 and SPOR domain-containing protein [Rudanella lutea]|uniref:SMODS-associated NUDIX domain-containing protein n=1 Tax=Rudanella lutea TaxID=451374 RepID=UPI0006950DD2|nr:HU-CCDC81 and SPOR domain-containing protein [Rudanella lutea]
MLHFFSHLIMPISEFIFSTGSSIAVNILSNRLDAFLSDRLPTRQRWALWRASLLASPNQYFRVSIAYLYRIYLDGEYLLIKGHRIDQYQPVGGVRKVYSSAKILSELGILDDDCLKIDDVSRQDLRVRVPARKLLKFLNWYESREDREVDQQREFVEELIKPGFLPANLFTPVTTQYRYTVPTFHFSPHFQCQELLYHEVFDVKLSPQQEQAMKHLRDTPSDQYVWVDEGSILMLGHDKRLKRKPFQIGEHARLLISKDHKLFNQ